MQVRVYIQRGRRKDDGISFIRVEARFENSAPSGGTSAAADDVIDDLWNVMLPLLDDIDTLLASFPGEIRPSTSSLTV